QCLYLGDIHRTHYQDLGQAEYYYKLGHDHSMRYAEQGICLIGDRRKVVDAYHKLLHDSKPAPVTAKSSKNIDVFAFAGGKPWKEIKDTFQHQLILYHAANELNSRQLAKKLALPASTLYSIRERLKVRGYLLPGKDQSPPSETHDLQGFIHQHGELNWDEINELFEREMIHYLYEKYGYNKNRMANILDLSYPSIISKTRELTRIDGHFLPN
ncbi:MAG: hypothetical protein U9Q77_03070, partial [Candidatus Marinimicrobia bacterium]|nr:hypothetical protein [Candidatus Neomarinimicrobiota bacterium]